MFDFNEVAKDVNTANSDIVNEISLELSDINPCALFFSLYNIPINGNQVGNSNFFKIDSIINENIHDNFIASDILSDSIFKNDNFKLVNNIISYNDGIDILNSDIIEKYRNILSLPIYPYIEELQEWKNEFFHIVYIVIIDGGGPNFI